MPRVKPDESPDLGPAEPIIEIRIQPPDPPFGGRWADSWVVYSGERLLSLETDQRRLLKPFREQQKELSERGAAHDQAWQKRLADSDQPPVTPEEVEAYYEGADAFKPEADALARATLLALTRYLVWKITDARGVTYVGGPDQIGWDSLPTVALLWLTERGKVQARNEVDGPLSPAR